MQIVGYILGKKFYEHCNKMVVGNCGPFCCVEGGKIESLLFSSPPFKLILNYKTITPPYAYFFSTTPPNPYLYIHIYSYIQNKVIIFQPPIVVFNEFSQECRKIKEERKKLN